jgi:predicted phosphohydrolase
LEFIKQNPIIPSGEILILAGDILTFKEIDQASNFLDTISKSFKKVFWIPGNHEYYGADINDRSNQFCECIRENVFLVNNFSEKIADVNFIFSTLWSKIGEENRIVIENTLFDFKAIINGNSLLSAEKFNEKHEECLTFIKHSLLKNKNEKNVVVSHHIPTFFNYPENFKRSIVNQGFATELYDLLFESSIEYWIYGHHHCNVPEFEINGTKLITNQLGYVQFKKNKLYRRDATFEI